MMEKPNVELVYTLFQKFQNGSRNAMQGPPGTWSARLVEQRTLLRKDFEAIGLAQHIDWEDR